jgi:hypothetical protein
VAGLIEEDDGAPVAASLLFRGLTAERMQAELKANVRPGAVLLTDEVKGYSGLQGTYDHYAVNHTAGEYVRLYFIHTNGMENAWSLFNSALKKPGFRRAGLLGN